MKAGAEKEPQRASSGPDRPIRDYFCLADGRTAALINPDGGCDFWCWPRFDSPFSLAALLDPGRGGSVGVTSARGTASSASWLGRSRVIRFAFPGGLEIQCGLVDDGTGQSALVWLVDGPAGELIQIYLADPSAGGGAGWTTNPYGALLGSGALPDGPGGPLILTVSSQTQAGRRGLVAQLPEEGLMVWLGAASEGGLRPALPALVADRPEEAVSRARELLARSVASDRRWLLRLEEDGGPLGELLRRAPIWAITAVDRSLLTLLGLQHRNTGLLVASPVTSVPQWPSSERSWDYRYAWLRDCADAGIALCHAGAFPEAESVARGLAGLLAEHPDLAAPVRRLSGEELPPEHFVSQLRGYSGSPVRIGNDAAGQVQLDTLGEVARLALELDRHQRCPDELLRQVPPLADAAVRRWRLPDHGIWEVRGTPKDYVHSKVMAWSALQAACAIAERGRIRGPVAAWQEESAAIETEVQRRGRGQAGELVMSFQNSGADSALLAAYLVSFIRPDLPEADATLRRVTRDLGRGPLMARHTPERDGIDAPCFPFIFPGLWAAIAEVLLVRSEAAEARLLAICQLAGPAGQLSEAADPKTGQLWGNYPQVQSHAALLDAALAIWAPPLRRFD
ncbi:MAG: glycoside hydrolase family 15 protein [Candidatus Dormiibacterota bacterium]